MIVIFGTRGRVSTIGSGRFFCPRCSDDREYALRGVRRWFTLFFLPIVPLGPARTLGVRCSTCEATFAEDVLNLPTSDVLRDQYADALRRCGLAVLKSGDAASTVARSCFTDTCRELLGDSGRTDDGLDADLGATDPSQLAVYASPMANRLDARQAERFFGACAQIALADGPLSPGERDALRNLGDSFNLSPAHQLGIIETLRAPSERGADEPGAPA